MAKHTVKYNPSTKSCRLDELHPGESFIIQDDERSERGEWPIQAYHLLKVEQPYIPPKSKISKTNGRPCILLGTDHFMGELRGNDGVIYQIPYDTLVMRVTMDITLTPA